MPLLRDELLKDRTVVLGGPSPSNVHDALVALGARVEVLEAPEALGQDEERLGQWARTRAPVHALVYDAGAPQGTDAVWAAVREVAVGALIPAEHDGKVVLIAPRPSNREHAGAKRAALGNLARTLSVEWARFAVTVVAVLPGTRTTDEQLAELVCFLCSRAAEYLSGCAIELGGLAPR